MKIINNSFNVLIALLLSVNNVNSHAIRDINPTLKKASECTEENHCGTDINCIAKCYNVLNPDEESMKRAYECQRTCNAKYPDPYIDTEELIQCYDKCIYKEFYRANNNGIDENVEDDNIHSQSSQSDDSLNKNDDINNNTDTTTSGEKSNNKNNQAVNNTNKSKVNSSTNTVVNDTDDNDNSNNSNNDNTNNNIKKRNLIAEYGLENQAFYSILVTELVLVLTLFYYVS